MGFNLGGFGGVLNQATRIMGTVKGTKGISSSITNIPSAIATVSQIGAIGMEAASILNQFSQKNVNQSYSTQIKSITGLTNQVNRYVFERVEVSGSTMTYPIEYSGYGPDVTGQAPSEYMIRVRNTKNWIIKGLMQESFKINTGSDWSSLVPTNFGVLVNSITQALGNRTLLTKWMTRRMWVGSKPLNFSITLKFNAVRDEWSEVVRPCLRLQQMALPSLPGKTGSAIMDSLPLIQPPGPSPFDLGNVLTLTPGEQPYQESPSLVNNVFTGRGDQIIIEIGKFLRFNNVILTNVDVTYASRMSKMGFPISSVAVVRFETYEMMTLEDLEAAHVRRG